MMQGKFNLVHTDLGKNSNLDLYTQVFSVDSLDQYVAHLLDEDFPWARQKMFGVLTHRANAWFSTDESAVYRYSGQAWPPHPLTPELEEIRLRLNEICGYTGAKELNSVLAALYPDGRAGVAWHDDNDYPNTIQPAIATVSLGETRKFKVRSKESPDQIWEFDLKHGDVVVMDGEMQLHFDHSISKTSRSVAPRVNLSYRTFLG